MKEWSRLVFVSASVLFAQVCVYAAVKIHSGNVPQQATCRSFYDANRSSVFVLAWRLCMQYIYRRISCPNYGVNDVLEVFIVLEIVLKIHIIYHV